MLLYSSTKNRSNLEPISNSFSTENEIYYSNALNPFIDEQISTNSSDYYTQEFQVEEGTETINYYYENNNSYEITIILEQKKLFGRWKEVNSDIVESEHNIISDIMLKYDETYRFHISSNSEDETSLEGYMKVASY